MNLLNSKLEKYDAILVGTARAANHAITELKKKNL